MDALIRAADRAMYAAVVAHFTDSYLLIALAGLGFTIASIETYKTFFFPNKPRGKFSGMPISHPEMLTKRKSFVPVYAGIWFALIATGVAAFSADHLRFIF